MSQTIAVLGRQPALGLAELESHFGDKLHRQIASQVALIDSPSVDFPLQRFGGTMKAAKLLTYIDTIDWQKLENYLVTELPKHTCCLPPGKVRLGLSIHGLHPSIKRLNATGLTLKKVVKNPPEGEGRSVRVVPNNELQLNTAQVIHNQLTGPTGMELLLIRDGERTALAQTFAVQDIDAYAARDQARPKRDARVGMLPPKLAQIIVNLTGVRGNGTLLDPFCGTGVVLQEALLMGYSTIGSDIEPRMIDYANENIDWLVESSATVLTSSKYQTYIADATSHTWEEAFDTIACETYLGQPFSAEPTAEKLRQVMRDVETIHRKFLKNVARQTKPGLRMCIAVPAWKTKNGFKHLKTLDSLEELGYTRMSFAHVRNEELLYHRPDQIVARELVVLIRK